MLYSYILQPQNTMHNQIQKQIRNNTQHISHHLKNIVSKAITCQRNLDLCTAQNITPINLDQDLKIIIDSALLATSLAQLNNRLKLLLARHHPTPPQDTPPYRPSSPHLTTTPASLIN